MNNILAIETATHVCSVALSKNAKIIDSKTSHEFNSHSEVLTVFIDEILKKNNLKPTDLDFIAISNGPGSYTGLRIGASVAKGMAYALNIPIVTICTIEALGKALIEKHGIEKAIYMPMIDARRMEVYTAFYNSKQESIKELQAFIIDENNLISYFKNQKVVIGGTGAQKMADTYSNQQNLVFDSDIFCNAEFIIPLALKKIESRRFADLAYFEPNYLKEFTGK